MLKYKDQIEEVIKALKILKKNKQIAHVDFTAPHIEEIYGDSECSYGILKTSFEITLEGEYCKINSILAEWKKVE